MAVPAIVNPNDGPGLWDILIVNGVVSPGIVELDGFDLEPKWDEKDGPGIEGASNTYRGNKLSKGTIKLRIGMSPDASGLTIEQQWAALPGWLDQWKFDPTKGQGEAAEVVHPLLLAGDPPITSLVAESIGKPQRARDGDSLYTITIKATEFRPPAKKNATSTPGGTSGGAVGQVVGAGIKPPTAQDANDAKIEQLLEKANQAYS